MIFIPIVVMTLTMIIISGSGTTIEVLTTGLLAGILNALMFILLRVERIKDKI